MVGTVIVGADCECEHGVAKLNVVGMQFGVLSFGMVSVERIT